MPKCWHILNKYSIDGVISPLSHLSMVEWLTANIFTMPKQINCVLALILLIYYKTFP